MNYLYFTLAIYFSLTVAVGLGMWIYLSTRRQICQLRRSIETLEQRLGPSPMPAADLKSKIRELEGLEPREMALQIGVPASEIELALRLVKPPAELVELRA